MKYWILIHFGKKNRNVQSKKINRLSEASQIKKKDTRYKNDKMKNDRFYQNYCLFFFLILV